MLSVYGLAVRDGTFDPVLEPMPALARDLRVACDDWGRDGTFQLAGGEEGDHSLGGSAHAAAS